jgi:ABC-type sulfate/molybdate transport systems ATPase subunit
MTWSVRVQTQLGSLRLDVALTGGRQPVALVGPNAAGKTTLLRIIAGGLACDRGQIALDEQLLYDSDARINLPPEDRGIGYVPQGYGMFPHLRVVDNVAFGLTGAGMSRRIRRQVALQMLGKLGCAHLSDRWPANLSGGEKQRVAIARALVVNPRFLLLDEPLSALDATSRRVLRSVLASQLATLGRPALVVTHDLRDVLALDASVVVLEAGRVVQTGSPQQLRDRPATDFVAEFFGPLDITTSPQGHCLASDSDVAYEQPGTIRSAVEPA